MSPRLLVTLTIVIAVLLFIWIITSTQQERFRRTNQYGTREFIEYDDYGVLWRVIIIDGCEYIQGNEVFVHKEDCKNPAHR